MEPTEREKQLARLAGGETNVRRTISPFRLEAADYITFMSQSDFCGTSDPLKLWPTIRKRFVIHARLAQRAFVSTATSGDAERFFSHAGDVCTQDRSSLAPETINMLTTCNMFLRRTLELEDKRSKKSREVCARFTALNAELEFVTPTDLDALLDALDDDIEPEYEEDEEEGV